MAKYYVKWQVSGLGEKVLETGKTYELAPSDVKALVSVANGGDVPQEEYAALIPQSAWDALQMASKRGELCANCRQLIV